MYRSSSLSQLQPKATPQVIFSALRPWIAAQVLAAMTAIPPDGWKYMG